MQNINMDDQRALLAQMRGGTAIRPMNTPLPVLNDAGLAGGTAAGPAQGGGLKPLPPGSALHQTGWLGDPSDIDKWVDANVGYISPGNSSPTAAYWKQAIKHYGGFDDKRTPNYFFGRMTHTDKEYNDALPQDNIGQGPRLGGQSTIGDMGSISSGLDNDFFNQIMRQLSGKVGLSGNADADKQALLSLMKRQ